MLSRDEAMELIERLPFIRTIQAPNDRVLEEFFEEAMAKNDCLEWIKIIKTCYIRQQDVSKKRRPLSPRAAAMGEKANALFQAEIAAALEMPLEEVDPFINNYLSENL